METKIIKSKEYCAYRNIKARCFYKNNKDYKNYGLRGISMCSEWVQSYQAFLKYVGPAPSKHHTIERINNNGNYEPGNVKWATRLEQVKNKRNSILLTYLCHTRSLLEWCHIFKLKYSYVWTLLRRKKINDVGDLMSIKFNGTFKTKNIPRIKTRDKPKYYHDLNEVLIRYGFK